MIQGPEGQTVYHSANLRGLSIEGALGFRTIQIAGQACRAGSFREPNYTIHVAVSLEPVEDFLQDVAIGLLTTLPLVGLMVFAGGLWLGKKAVAPVAALSAAAESISVENLAERLPMPEADDEIARLTVVLNDAFARLNASYEAATRFSADASHQLKTPVAVLRAGLESLRDGGHLDGDGKTEVETLLRQVRRLTGLIQDLLLLARTDARRLSLESQPFDLADLAASALDDLETLTYGRLEVESEIETGITVCADRRHLAIIVQNLVENAAKYTPDGGRVRLTVKRDGNQARFSVANTGPALPEEDREGIFERFRRGSKVGENQSGHGLGLNIALALARSHGGDLTLVRSDGEWNEFALTLPVV
jgi:signal transduction histidine kinase